MTIYNTEPVYFDNATTSFPKPACVAKAVFDAISTLGAPNRGAHSMSLDASRLLFKAREAVAKLFGAGDPRRAVFTSGATEALNTAINGLLTQDNHVITTVTEHNSVLRPLYRLGCEIDYIPCGGNGTLAPDNVEKLLKPSTKAVIVSHVSNVTGNIADVSYFSKFCREHGLYFILDCAQSSADILPFAETTADVICFTGHKALFGPQGTGGMIVMDCPVKPLKVGGAGFDSYNTEHPSALPDSLEAGTPNCHGISGLLSGIAFIEKTGAAEIAEKEKALANRFISGVSEIKGARLYGDFTAKNRAPVVSLLLEGYGSAEISERLSAEFNIQTRSGAHCAPLMHKALGTEKTGLTRFSFSYFNTEEQIDYAVNALSKF